MTIYVSVVIDAPPTAVWAVVERIERHGDWMADADQIRFETTRSAAPGPGSRSTRAIGPFRITDHMIVVDWIDEAVISVEHTGYVTGMGQFTLDRSVDGGTLFAWEEDLHLPWWLGGRIGDLVSAPVLKWVWRHNLQRLKAQVEARRPADAG